MKLLGKKKQVLATYISVMFCGINTTRTILEPVPANLKFRKFPYKNEYITLPPHLHKNLWPKFEDLNEINSIPIRKSSFSSQPWASLEGFPGLKQPFWRLGVTNPMVENTTNHRSLATNMANHCHPLVASYTFCCLGISKIQGYNISHRVHVWTTYLHLL